MYIGVVDFLTLSDTIILSMLSPGWTEKRVRHPPTSLLTCGITLHGGKTSALSSAGVRTNDNHGLVQVMGMMRAHVGPKRLDFHKQTMTEAGLFLVAFECNDILNTAGGNQLRLSGFTSIEARKFLADVCNGSKVSSLSLNLRRDYSHMWAISSGHMKALWYHISQCFVNLHTLHMDQPEFTKDLMSFHQDNMIEATMTAIDDVDQYNRHGEPDDEFQNLVPNGDSDFYMNMRELRIRVVELTNKHWLQAIIGFGNLTTLVLERTSPFPQRQTQLVEIVMHHNAQSLENVDLIMGMPLRNVPAADLVSNDTMLKLPVNTQKIKQLRMDVGPGFSVQLTPSTGADFLPRNHRAHVEITTARAHAKKRSRASQDLVSIFESTGECTVLMHTGAIRRRLL
jgi:hypothetical protein